MTMLTPIDPKTLAARLKAGQATLIDIREPDEYAREHIVGAVSVPLSSLERGRLNVEPQGDVVFHCKSGMRTNANCARLAAHVDGTAFVLDGGIEAWKQAGLGVERKRS
jgi:rhodanese-related sulfurtransferase